jgi:hypothetical protein
VGKREFKRAMDLNGEDSFLTSDLFLLFFLFKSDGRILYAFLVKIKTQAGGELSRLETQRGLAHATSFNTSSAHRAGFRSVSVVLRR